MRTGIELRPQKKTGVPLRKLNWNGLKGTGSVKMGSVLFIYADNEPKSVLRETLVTAAMTMRIFLSAFLMLLRLEIPR